MKLVKSEFKIVAGRLLYTNNDFEKQIVAMKDKHEGEFGEVIFEIVDKVQHFQHRYYRGYLLPDVTFALGEIDQSYVHEFILKPKFLARKIEDHDWHNIPNKHRSNCRIITRIITNQGGEKEEVPDEYCPSTGVLTYDEMAQYIKDVENFLTLELNGCVGMSAGQDFEKQQAEALDAREMALNIQEAE